MIMTHQTPSPFQMFSFLYSADTVIADIPFGLGRVANYLIGQSTASHRSEWGNKLMLGIGYVIGGLVLGYQARYKVFDP